MDDSVNAHAGVLPVTLALACALEERGDLFAAAQAVLDSGQSAGKLAPLASLLRDMIAPLVAMGAVYSDAHGRKHIDRQAVCDFGIVACGLARHVVLHELTLHELALYHRRMAGGRLAALPPPSADFLAQMQELFPDQ